MRISIKKFFEAEDLSTGKKAIFEIVNETKMNLIHPVTGELLYHIEINGDGALLTAKDPKRTPHDAGRCMLECSRGCNGDLECVAGCALMCATIII